MKRLALCTTLLIMSQTSFAAKKTRPRVRRGPAAEGAATSTAPSAASAPAKGLPRMVLARAGLTLGQESIAVQGTDEQTTMEIQLQGLSVAGVWSYPFGRSRWSRLYMGEFGAGVVKGKANGVEVNDAVKGQPFMLVAAAPGLSYITSPVSRVGLMIPFVIRQIKWKVGAADGFDPDRDFSFSLGISGVFETRFTIRSSLIVSATYQHLWQSTTYALSYQRRFR